MQEQLQLDEEQRKLSRRDRKCELKRKYASGSAEVAALYRHVMSKILQ